MPNCKHCNDAGCLLCEGDEALREFRGLLDGMSGAFNAQAMMTRGYYEAYMAAGFSESQSLLLAEGATNRYLEIARIANTKTD